MSNVSGINGVISGIIAIIATAKTIEADGKVDINDLPALMGLIPLIAPTIADVKEIPSEISGLQTADAEQIVATVMADLKITNEKAVTIVNQSLAALVAIVGLVKAVKS